MNEMILSWLSSHIPMVATWIISLGAISIAIKKYGPKIRKFISVGRHGLDVIDSLMDALTDDKITDEEIAKLLAEVQAFKDSIK